MFQISIKKLNWKLTFKTCYHCSDSNHYILSIDDSSSISNGNWIQKINFLWAGISQRFKSIKFQFHPTFSRRVRYFGVVVKAKMIQTRKQKKIKHFSFVIFVVPRGASKWVLRYKCSVVLGYWISLIGRRWGEGGHEAAIMSENSQHSWPRNAFVAFWLLRFKLNWVVSGGEMGN